MSIILRDRLIVPSSQVTPEILQEFTYQFSRKAYLKAVCGNCVSYEFCLEKDDRIYFWKAAGECREYSQADTSFLEDMQTYYQEEDNYYFQRGNIQKLERLFGPASSWIDERSIVPMDFPLKFNGTLRTEQSDVTDAWLSNMHGIIIAPTRWGKTILLINLICLLQQRALILVHMDFMDQWLEKIYKFTNALKLESDHNIKMVGVLDKEPFPCITLSTFQKFGSKKGKKLLEKYRNYWGTNVTDEVHHVSAPTFAEVKGLLNPYFRIGCSANPTRKDGTEVVIYDIVGSPVAQGYTQQLQNTVEYIYTDFEIYPGEWVNNSLNKMVYDKDRNDLIFYWARTDLKEGRRILVICSRKKHVINLAEALCDEGYKAMWTMGKNSDKNLVKKIKMFNEGEIDILFSTSVLGEAYDIPACDTVYAAYPNNSAQFTEQLSGRNRTPYENKKNSLLRDFVDKGTIAMACRSTRHKVYVKLGFNVPDIYAKKEKSDGERPISKALKKIMTLDDLQF